MKILTVSPYYKPAYVYGGPTRSVAALCEGMQKSGAQVTVYTTNANGSGAMLDVPVCQAVSLDGVNVTYFPLSDPVAKLFPFYSSALYHACRAHTHEFDIVYIVGDWTYNVLAAGRSAYINQIPYVISPRGSLMEYCIGQKALKKWLYLVSIERKLLERAAALHVSSKLEDAQLCSLNLHNPTIIIPNPVNIARFEKLPHRGGLRDSLGWPSDAIVSLYVGRLHKQKRISLTVEAFARVSHCNPNAYLLMVGPDEDGSGNAAQLQARHLGVAEKVHFTGLLKGDELLQAYADANLLVLFSYSESFGMVVAEAMAAGLPVLLSKEVGLAAEAEDAGAGLGVDAVIEDIATTWIKMLQDPNHLEQMGIQGKSMARDKFHIGRISNRMIEFLTALAKNNNLDGKETKC